MNTPKPRPNTRPEAKGAPIIRMTPHTKSDTGLPVATEKDAAGAPVLDIEVTSAMAAAGAAVLFSAFDGQVPYGASFGEHVAREVFEAMQRVARSESGEFSKRKQLGIALNRGTA